MPNAATVLHVHGRILRSAAVLALAALATPLPSHAADIFKSSGGTLVASFSSTDASGCVLTTADVNAGENINTIQMSGSAKPTNTPSAFISVFQYNFCTSAYLYASGVSSSLVLEVDGALKAGSLERGYAGLWSELSSSPEPGSVCFSVAVSLDWIGTGELDRVNDVTHLKSGNTIVTDHFNGSSRNASAFGTIFGSAVNWTPRPSSAAFIGFALGNQILVD